MSVSAGLHSKAAIYDDALDALTFGLTNQLLNDNSGDSIKPFSSSSSSSSTSSSSSSSASHGNSSSSGNNFSHMNGFGELETSAKSSNATGSNKAEHMCLLCKKRLVEPKLLSCLHSFCKQCLITHSITEAGDATVVSSLCCPKCKQETFINGNLGIDGLEDDLVMLNMLDLQAMEERILDCTSCKTDEKAVARCADCANFLCPSCVSAHQYMRCFENHRVVRFEEIRASFLSSKSAKKGSLDGGCMPIHKPLFCRLHPRESLKFFCHTCQIPLCTDCVVNMHQGHMCDQMSAIESKVYDELQTIIDKSKEKIEACQSEFQVLDQYLNSLQEQAESSKGLIEETFISYKAMLEKKKDELLKELDEKHSTKELAIMDLHNSIDASISQLNNVVKFTERILKNGNSQEVLMLKRLVVNQTKHLFAILPQIDNIDINLRFMTDEKRFERAVNDFFGRFYPFKEAKPQVPASKQHMAAASLDQQQQLRLQHIQRQFELQQLAQSSHPAIEQEWLLLNKQSSASSLLNAPAFAGDRRGSIHSPMSPATAPPEEWLLNMMKLSNAGAAPLDELQQHQQQQQWLLNNMAVFNSANKLNHQQQLMLNTLQTLQPPVHNFGQARSNSPMIDSLIHTNSRSHTPSGLIVPGALKAGDSAAPVVMANNLDDFLALNSNSSMAQNFSQLSKLIAPSVELANLNELVLNAAAMGAATGLSDVNSNASQSPPVNAGNALVPNVAQAPIGSGLNSLAASTAANPQTGFVGNGNLNPPIRQNGKMSNMQIRTKFGTLGSGKSQFNSPHGFCLGADEEIIVADTNNHRIQVFGKEGEMRFSFGSPGRDEGQLWYPRKVAVMRDTGKFVVCDRGNERSRMQIFNKHGHFLKKIAIRYIDIVAGLAITQNGDIVAVDSVSPTVFRVSEDGEILKWFECSDHMREPSDIAISGNEYYVCDFKGHCVVVFNEEGNFMRRIGGENITNFPNGIDVSDAGDVLVGDSHGNRFHVAVFSRDGSMLSEFECPYVKVSRCCGLKITSEGYVVTLAKNNHHVLVLNTLYVS